MLVAMIVVVRDEVDILEAHLRYHLEHGVDVIVATDHGSTDGTADVLAAYERDGVLKRIDERDRVIEQGLWATRMARFAAIELKADWIIAADADEFWCTRRGDLRSMLESIPSPFGVVRGLMRHFPPRPESPDPLLDRMIVRTRSLSDHASPYTAQVKIAARAVPTMEITRGNHDAYGPGLRLIREWFPVEVLHFPIRSRDQWERKIGRRNDRPAAHVAAARALISSVGLDAAYAKLVIDDDALTRGIADGTLAVDTRIADALAGRPTARVDEQLDDRAFVDDVAAFMETDSVIVADGLASAVEERLASVEKSVSLRPTSALRRRLLAR
jgi:hypothetical protein